MVEGITIYKEVEKKLVSEVCPDFNKDTEIFDHSWIHVTTPTAENLTLISEKTSLNLDFLLTGLDEEETARIDKDEGDVLIVLDAPCTNEEGEIYTEPFIIVYNQHYYVTISKSNQTLLNSLFAKVKNLEPSKKVRLTLNIIYQLSREFITYLKTIDKHTKDVEQRIHTSMKNKEIFELMDINKTFVYFSTALNANKAVLSKLLKSPSYKKFEDDLDLMEDAQVELDQAIEMCNIYRDILAGMMDAFASIISNNLNIVMKTLSIITIVISIPTLIASLFGMNFSEDNSPLYNTSHAFWIVLGISVGIGIIGAIIITLISRKTGKK